MTAQLSRERIEQYANDPRMCNVNEEIRTMARMLLAGLDSEPGEYLTHVIDDGFGEFSDRMNFSLPVGTKLYTAPPAPVAVPDDLLHMAADAIEDLLKNGNSDSSAAVWFDMPGKLRAAMLKAGPVTAATVPDGWTSNCDADAALVMLDRIDTIDCDDDERIESIKNIIRRLAAAPEQQNAQQNIPENIPGGWIKCSEQMPDAGSEQRVCAYTPSPHIDVRFRMVKASMFKQVCCDATHWQYMAAPEREV